MIENRSIPRCTVIPELGYADVDAAAAWLHEAFGFTLRIAMGGHRAQLNVGDGAVALTSGACPPRAVLVRIEDAHAHHARAVSHGARIVREPADHSYGERQYTAVDLGGHVWTFSQSIADVAPEEWGGTSGELR